VARRGDQWSQAAECFEDDSFGRGRLGGKRERPPVAIGFKLADPLIDSIPIESFHATFAQRNAAALR
jgi:hypothetical protein